MAPQVTYPTQTTTAPGGTAGIGQTAVGSIPGLSQYNYYGSLTPEAMQIGQGMVNDPSAMAYLNAAYGGGALGTAGALGAYGAGANLYGLGGPTIQTAFDPQQQLYNRTLNQMTEQAQAGLASSGLLNTPWGQGVLGQDISNFNIDWGAQQQAKQLAGLNALNQMYPTAAGLQQGAVPWYTQAGGLPWTTGQQIGGAGLNTLQGLAGFGAQGAQIPQQQFQNYLNYLGWATPAEQQAFNQAQTTGYLDPMGYASAVNQQRQQAFSDAMQQNQQAWNQQQQMFTGLGRLAGGLGGFAMGGLPGAMIGSNIFGGGGGGGGGGGYGGWGSNLSTQPFGGLGSMFGFQYGGEPPVNQPSLVGEDGPELFVPRVSGTIIPNPQTAAQMGGGAVSPYAMAALSRGGQGSPPMPFGQAQGMQQAGIARGLPGGLPTGGSGMDTDMPSGPFMPGMPGSHGPGSPYPMGMPFEGQLAGIGAFGKGFQRPGGMGWQYGGGFC